MIRLSLQLYCELISSISIWKTINWSWIYYLLWNWINFRIFQFFFLYQRTKLEILRPENLNFILNWISSCFSIIYWNSFKNSLFLILNLKKSYHFNILHYLNTYQLFGNKHIYLLFYGIYVKMDKNWIFFNWWELRMKLS